MSRWIEAFNSHEYKDMWEELKQELSKVSLLDDTIVTDDDELSRLKKVTWFIDELLSCIDPELMPLDIWDKFKEQCQIVVDSIKKFESDKQIAHIITANRHADNLLTYIRPYMVADQKSAKALQKAVHAVTSELRIDTEKYKERISSLKQKLEEYLEKISNTYGLIVNLKAEMFGDDEAKGYKQKIEEAYSSAEEQKEKIEQFHALIFEGSSNDIAIEAQIEEFVESASEKTQKIKELFGSVKSEVKELEEFYIKVFGDSTSDNSNESLAREIENRKNDLVELEKSQTKRFENLYNEIEGLLPGATSAGLASVYHETKESFEKPIQKNSKAFIIVLCFLILVGCSSLFNINDSSWDLALKSILNRLPIYGALIWAALFFSRRRSEAERLKQEYAHKEALARSYLSYKKQIEELEESDQEMLKSLIKQSIDTIAYNASKTLDGKHGDKPPVQELADKIVKEMSRNKVLIELFKSVFNK